MIRLGRFAAAYTCMGVTSAVVALVWRGSPMVFPRPWLRLDPAVSHTYSLLLGAAFGLLIAVLTRPMVARFEWAKQLHNTLRPVARGMSTGKILILAMLSAVGEELLFRGLLEPWIGLLPQALLFGLAHQVSGRSRWVWAVWACLMGLALGALFELTGSLWGPLACHALINAMNLLYLKSHDPEPKRPALGGLLGERP